MLRENVASFHKMWRVVEQTMMEWHQAKRHAFASIQLLLQQHPVLNGSNTQAQQLPELMGEVSGNAQILPPTQRP